MAETHAKLMQFISKENVVFHAVRHPSLVRVNVLPLTSSFQPLCFSTTSFSRMLVKRCQIVHVLPQHMT